MGLKRIGRGLFKGPTKGNLYQTLDIGAGELVDYARQQAIRFPDRRYAAVDPAARAAEFSNLRIFRKPALEALDDAIKEGLRVRHINMFMPEMKLKKPKYFREILIKAKKIMRPNGKIFIGTNNIPHWTNRMAPVFDAEGFSLKKPKLLHEDEWSRWMHITTGYARHVMPERRIKFYLIEATFRLKTARKMGYKV